jgi:CDP-diacylglycerol---glycerol-3-phosphate 3-phosphatidyltransferase
MATVNERDDAAVERPGPGFGPEVRLSPAPIDRRSLNLPNAITLSRLILSIVLFAMIGYPGLWLTSAILFVVAAATDFLDGYFARKYGQVTTLGRIMDPFVDKIIICGAFVFLLEKRLDSGINSWIVIIVIGREMFVTSLRGFLERLGLDFSANWSGKLKMITQCVAVTASILSLEPSMAARPGFLLLRNVLIWTCVAVTIHSGWIYIQRAAVMLRPRASE